MLTIPPGLIELLLLGSLEASGEFIKSSPADKGPWATPPNCRGLPVQNASYRSRAEKRGAHRVNHPWDGNNASRQGIPAANSSRLFRPGASPQARWWWVRRCAEPKIWPRSPSNPGQRLRPL